jgi:hypothetical protein
MCPIRRLDDLIEARGEPMEYMLMICYDDTFTPPDSLEPETVAWVQEMEGRGVRKSGDRLRPATDATTVRVRNDEVMLSDGPFAETKEQMGGYDLIECADLDEAIEVASRHPMAKIGVIEVRPVWRS